MIIAKQNMTESQEKNWLILPKHSKPLFLEKKSILFGKVSKNLEITVFAIFQPKLGPNFALKYTDREFKFTFFCFQMIKKIQL